MTKSWRPLARFSMIAVPLLLSASVILESNLFAQAAPGAAVDGASAQLFDFAGQVTRLVQNGRIDDLAKLNIPSTSPALAELKGWAAQYVVVMKKQQDQRDKQFKDASDKAQDYLKHEKYDMGLAQMDEAYRIAKDPAAFLTLDWVKDATAKVAARAFDLEHQGNWIESLQLFSELNTLYEIDTRYKADMQRLARRTRLLAVYVPKTFYDMRKALLDSERDPADPATTKPADDEAAAGFPRWQDMVENIAQDMCRDAIDHAAADWVEKTSYEALLKGGIESLRLFLTTPEVSKEFPGLADAAARKTFNDALDAELASIKGKDLDSNDVNTLMTNLIQASNNSVKLPKEVLLMEFTDGAMELLDPFTAVIWPHELAEFEKSTTGEFSGVGIQISLENGILKVISPLEDTPAYKAGIEADDLITKIDGKTTLGISVDSAVSSITGPKGTPVTLTIKRGTEPERDFKIIRDSIKVTSVKGFRRDPGNSTRWDYMIDTENKIGYVRVTGFQPETATDLRAALTEMQKQGMQGVVLDFRFNPGGLLTQAIEISDMFLQNGVIVSTRGRTIRAGSHEWPADAATQIPPNMPMVVMVNEYSASAAEIFSGAMKDLHRALIVGHRSFGKGSVQNIFQIGNEVRPDGSDMAKMKLTMAYYYLPNGESLHRRDQAKTWGVDPDVVDDLTPSQLQDMLTARRDSEIIHTPGDAPATAPATGPAASQPAPAADTQLDTAILMMRLQLIQANADKVAGK